MSIAAGAVGFVAVRPRSRRAAVCVGALAAADVAVLGPESVRPALVAAAPMLAVLTVAVLAAAAAVRAGLPPAAGRMLAAAAGDRPITLLGLVCVLTAALTAVATLDAAVVLMVPVVVEVSRRTGVSLRALVLGVVAVANSFSLALPEGNPTNLVVMQRLGLDPWHTPARTVLPGLVAALLCAVAVVWCERRALRVQAPADRTPRAGFSVAAGLEAVARTSVQVLSLLVVLLPLAHSIRPTAAAGLRELLLVTLACSALAALVNNLPASTLVVVAVGPGPAAYAALAGLSIGALATRQGSVATLIAGDLTGTPSHARVLAPAAVVAALVATTLIWAGI